MGMRINLNNIRLRSKMLIVYFLCVLIPIVLTNIIFYLVTTQNVKEQRLHDIELALEQIASEVRAVVEDAMTVSSVFYTDYNLNELLETSFRHPSEYISAYDSYYRRILNSYTPVFNAVQSIKIYVDNPTLLHSGGIGHLSDEVKQLDWYGELARTSNSQPVFVRTVQEDPLIPPDKEAPPQDTFSIVRRMDYFPTWNNWEKVLKIDLKTTTIRQLFQNLNLPGHLYLVDEQGYIEYTNDPAVDFQRALIAYETIAHAPDTIEVATKPSTAYYMDGWRIVAAIPEEVIFEEVRKSRDFIVLLACINILIPTLVIIWITRSMSVRLVRILRHMKRVKNQHFTTIENGESADEIGQLTGEFNRMTLQIKSLIDDVYVADIQKKNLELERRKAQLNALQSQINPHFLFNALETIRMRSLIKQETETARTIHNMAKIFRNSLSWGKDWVTVREETDLVVSFLEIQKYRFGDKLNYCIQVDPTAENAKIPKMILQPFVENASIHGIEPLNGSGVIEVAVGRREDMLVFDIKDNGAGMAPETLAELLDALRDEPDMGERIGIKNVYYRLRLLYGDRLVFDIKSRAGEGTAVRLEFPEHAPYR